MQPRKPTSVPRKSTSPGDSKRTQYDPKPSPNNSTSDLEATPRTTAKSTTVEPQCGNETNDKRVEEICEARTTPVSDRVAAMEGAIPRMSTILEDILARLAKMEAPEQQQPTTQESLTEAVNTLRGDVNVLLEDKSTLLPKEKNSENIGHTVPSEQELPLAEVPKKTPTLADLAALMKAQEEDSHPAISKNFNNLEKSSLPSASRRTYASKAKSKIKKSPRSGISRAPHYETTSSEESDSNLEECHNSSDDENGTAVAPFALRDKGPKHPGLASLQPSDGRYDKLLSYRYYRLKRVIQTRNSSSTTRLISLIKNLELTFSERKFDGKDPILILDFLARFTEECDILGMTEGQAFMALPKFLAKTAATQYRARQHGGHAGGITAWPEAVQYLLRTYATPGAIRRATSDLRTIRQLPDEDESAYAARINEAAYRCGNIHLEDEKMTFFVDGLQPELRTTVARYREDQPRHEMTLERLVHHAQDEGDALRARIIAEGERVRKR